MRSPLLSGAVGSAATLTRLCEVVRPRGPVVVLSALWLAEALSSELPVTAVVESDQRRAAKRAAKRAAAEKRRLAIVAAGESLPLGAGAAGAVVIENLAEIEDDAEAAQFLAGLTLGLRPGGLLIALEATRSSEVEARLAGLFLASALVDLVQERPREGAVLTIGAAPAPVVVAARLGTPAE